MSEKVILDQKLLGNMRSMTNVAALIVLKTTFNPIVEINTRGQHMRIQGCC